MLPRTTWRITAPPLRWYGSRATRLAADDDGAHEHFPPSYNDGAAGPSSLRSGGSASLTDTTSARAPVPTTPPSNSLLPSSSSHRKTSRHSARLLREGLAQVPCTAYWNTTLLLRIAGLHATGDQKMFDRRLSRLEKHVVLHHLIRKSMGAVGVRFARRFVHERSHLRMYNRHDSALSLRTLDALFKRPIYKLPQLRTHIIGPDTRPPRPDPLPQPTVEDQTPEPAGMVLQLLLTLLFSFKDHHHPRPHTLYSLIISQCLHENRPDLAAKVYAILVEDWIMEGRVAEGADPDDFRQGGVPALGRETSASSKPLFNLWFGTVRTWRLPGEALSLHDRLDLWHPQHAAPDERLRGFPIPTSPPSQTPQPTVELLVKIVDFLYLDPHRATPVEYATSMRALAILANTILSRSLPIPAIPRLLQAFSRSVTHPAVYPDQYHEPPKENAWAYTASTQVHVALMSLMWSPPNYARALEIQKLSVADPLPVPEGASRYALHPLGWQACVVLVHYATMQLKKPRLLFRLLQYMKETFIDWTPNVLNRLFRSATQTRDTEIAQMVDQSLFDGSSLSAQGARERAQYLKPTASTIPNCTTLDGPPVAVPPSESILDLPNVQANPSSIIALILHLTATSQFDRLRDTAYVLIPFLSINMSTGPDRIAEIAKATGTVIGYSGRLQPSELTPTLYTVIVNGLAKGGFFDLAQRVFYIAKKMEKTYIRRLGTLAETKAVENGLSPQEAVVSLRDTVPFRLPIPIYTSMMYIYGREARRESRLPNRVSVSHRLEHLSYARAVRGMALSLYIHVARRWEVLDHYERQLLRRCIPDAPYFDAVIYAFSPMWKLDEPTPPTPEIASELRLITEHMVALGVEVPAGLREKQTFPHVVKSDIYIRGPPSKTHVSEYAKESLSSNSGRGPTISLTRLLDAHIDSDDMADHDLKIDVEGTRDIYSDVLLRSTRIEQQTRARQPKLKDAERGVESYNTNTINTTTSA